MDTAVASRNEASPGLAPDLAAAPAWTLSARRAGDAVQFDLTDGRRLSLRATQAARRLDERGAEALLGAEIAARLAASAPRVLNLQLDAALDAVAWESLALGGSCLGRQFAVARQIVSDAEPAVAAALPLGEALAVAVVHRGDAPAGLHAPCFALDALGQREALDAVTLAQVVVLHRVTLSQLQWSASLRRRERLVVATGREDTAAVAAMLDRGAAVLALGPPGAVEPHALRDLLLQLGGGASAGEAARSLHQRAAPAPADARLYGDAALRFVRPPAQASRRQVTSLSFDLVGSTAVLQQLGDEAYAELLADLHARCTDIVRQHGGQPDDPQGDDGVMSYFGHPSAVEDAAAHAVEAGLQIVRMVAALGVSVRVGIATGPVAVRAGQPVGLSIHLAARLQQVTAPGSVLISQPTRQLVGDAFELRELSDLPALKGIDTAGRMYLVWGRGRDAGLHRLERLPWLTPLVGREAELERLAAAWRGIGSGRADVVLVRGDAGIGKSRLVREFRSRLANAHAKVLECRCRADASASPYLALSEALKRWLEIAPGEPDAQALLKLDAALPAAWRGRDEQALLAALLGLAPAPANAASGNAQRRVVALLLGWFERFAMDRPCCLIVEDWHWVDPSMSEFVEHLVRRRGGPGLLVVITLRTGAAPALPRAACVDEIELAGLPPAAASALVVAVRTDAPLPASVVRALVARGDGVPLFLEEATRMAYERGADRLALDATSLDEVPASLHDLLMARLDGTGAARPVAQVAAVLGREFTFAMLAALLDGAVPFARGGGVLTEHLAVLEASGLLRAEGGGRYAFKHALVRDTAYASLWTRDRQALHARMVELLRERWPELAAHRPELLAHHLSEAGLHEQALAQWELAARSATARSAEREAISHLHRALALLAQTPAGAAHDRIALRLQLLLAARLIATEGYGADAVGHAYADAARLCEALGDEAARFKCEMGLEGFRFMRADFAAALEHGRHAAALARASGDPRQRLHAHWGLACTLFHQGALRATMRELELGLALYTPALHRQFGVQDPGVMCMAYRSWALWERARPDAAVAQVEQAIELATGFEHKFSQAVALAYATSVYLLRGESEPALARADACIAVCEDAGFPVWLAITRCMRGRLLCERGEFAPGLAEMRAGHALWLATGSAVSQPLYLALQAEGLALAGDIDAAVACVDDGLAIVARYGERQYEAELRRLRGEFALRRGEPGAPAWLVAGHALALRQHKLGFALRSAISLARLWAGSGRRERARRLLERWLARWQEGLQTRDLREARALYESLV